MHFTTITAISGLVSAAAAAPANRTTNAGPPYQVGSAPGSFNPFPDHHFQTNSLVFSFTTCCSTDNGNSGPGQTDPIDCDAVPVTPIAAGNAEAPCSAAAGYDLSCVTNGLRGWHPASDHMISTRLVVLT
jgi:hypothetical protein